MHYLIYVLSEQLPGDAAHAESIIEPILAPYSEHLEVDPYMEECWCVGNTARSEAHEQNKTRERMDAAREQYQKEFQPFYEEECAKLGIATEWPDDYAPPGARQEWFRQSDQARHLASERVTPSWQQRYEAIDKDADEIEKNHPLYKKPEADCDECKGSGERESTCNPDGQWDWYQIGGRWNGHLVPDYDPGKDPKNTEMCRFCDSTGTRTDSIALSQNNGLPKRCNVCDGKGHATTWPTQWSPDDAPEGGNWRKVADILDMDKAGLYEDDYVVSYGVVTPDGWRGKHWKNTSEQDAAWPAEFRSLLADYPNHYAIAVDIHS